MKVSVCNLRENDFREKFIHSIIDTGFAVITHHGIDKGLIKDAQDGWRQFFLSPKSHKNIWINKDDPNMGYKAFEKEKAVGSQLADLKEFYHWQPGKEIPGEVYSVTQKMFFLLEDVSSQLLSVIDSHSQRNGFYRNACQNSDNTIIRTLYYPALNFKEKNGAVRAAAHEDINFITLLVAASSAGLEVKDVNGNWHNVPHEENSIVMNIGDMLQLASKGLYKSTTHRVSNPENSTQDRISMPLFVHPHGETLLAENFTAKQYLDQRLKEIYLKG